MDFGITKFMSKVDSLGGLARKNKFTVEVAPPRTLVSDVEASTISFLAKGAQFPARTFGTTTYRSGGRHALDVPYETTFEAVGLTMQNTNNHAPRRFWENWLNHIQSVGKTPGAGNYYMQYYKKFIGTIIIKYYNESFKETGIDMDYEITLHDAWPKVLGSIDLGWDNSEFSDFSVDVAYSHWTSKTGGISYSSSDSNTQTGSSFLQEGGGIQ